MYIQYTLIFVHLSQHTNITIFSHIVLPVSDRIAALANIKQPNAMERSLLKKVIIPKIHYFEG